jgi:hypothetical protein
LCRALLGTWRLVSLQSEVDGTFVKPLGENPPGYLMYTPDNHVLVQFATRAERIWPGPEVLKLPPPEPIAAIGFAAYCGTFHVRDGELVHHTEFGSNPSLSGRKEARAVVLEGDRLILGTPTGALYEWQRVRPEGKRIRLDSELRQMLLGTWRLTSVLQEDVGGPQAIIASGQMPSGCCCTRPPAGCWIRSAGGSSKPSATPRGCSSTPCGCA